MANNKKIKGEIEKIVRDMAEKGYNPTTIGKQVNLAKDTIKKYLIENNLPIHTKTNPEKQLLYKQVIEYLPQAAHASEIIKKFKITKDTLQKIVQGTGYESIIRTRAEAQQDRIVPADVINERIYPDVFVKYEVETKKYILRAPDGFEYSKNSAHLYQGDPRGKSGTRLTVSEVNKRLRLSGFQLAGRLPNNLKSKAYYRHYCGNVQRAKFPRLESGKTKCKKCNVYHKFPQLARTVKKKSNNKKKCVICSTLYTHIKRKTYQVCGVECYNKLKPLQKIRTYTEKQIELVIKLKKQGVSNLDISKQAKVNINTIKNIVKTEGLYLSKQISSKNSGEGKRKYHQTVMETVGTDHERILHLIKKDVEDGRGSVTYISSKYGLNGSGVVLSFKKRGWGHLIGNNSSGPEIEVQEYVKSIEKSAVVLNDRGVLGGKELDILIPEKKIAIEFNGLYYHSTKFLYNGIYLNYNKEEVFQSKLHYHKQKTDKCAEYGIKLIHIFEDEWIKRKEQVKGYLKATLGLNSVKVYARKCESCIVSPVEAKEFVNQYHIQPMTKVPKYAIGLRFNGELVGLMCFDKHHRVNDNETIVLNRMVFKSDYTVVAGATKMLSKALSIFKEKEYKTIVTWSDNRWSTGNVYKLMGFIQSDQEVSPTYSYYKTGYERINKQSFKRDNLLKMVKDVTPEIQKMSEKQLSELLGFYRIYDCGKKKWEYPIHPSNLLL